MEDFTKSHSQQFTDSQGKKHVVIKPLRIERKPNANGGTDVIVTVPRLSLKPKSQSF